MSVYMFYFLIVIPIFYELCVLSESEKYTLFLDRLKNHKENILKDSDLFSKVLLIGCVNIFYFVYLVVGLFTSQWILFLFLFVLSLFGFYFSKVKSLSVCMWWHRVDSFLSVCILFFIIINKFHFHYDLWSMIK
jgi:hypothetical protein